MTPTAPIADKVNWLEPPGCQHHWDIPPANGPVSLGICQNCGAIKEFKNSVEALAWGDEQPGSGVAADLARVLAKHRADDEEE